MPSIYESPFLQSARQGSGSVLWSDYLKQAGAGAVGDVAASVPAGARYVAEALPESRFGDIVAGSSHYLEDKLNEWGEDISSGLSPTAQRRIAAEFASPEFWEHPFSSTALTATRSAPSMAAAAAATLLTSGGTAGLAALMATGGYLSAGETVDEMYQATDNQSDAELRRTSPLYAGMREDGISEVQARKEFNSTMLGLKPVILGAFGGLTTLIGPEAQALRLFGKAGIREAAEGGILKRVGKASGEAFIGETAETGAEDITSQQGAVDVGLQPAIDVEQTVRSSLYGGVIGAALGFPGGVPRAKTHANPRPEPINPPAAIVSNAVKPNQPSVPARGSNTNASPPIVTPTGKHTGPTSRTATIPGAKGDAFKKSKQAPGTPRRPSFGEPAAGTPAAVTPATTTAPVPGALAGVAPAPTTPQAPQGDPTGLVAGPTETAALNVQVAPTGTVGPQGGVAPTVAPTPTPAPRTPSQVQQATGVPYAQAREVAAQEGDTSGLTPAGNVAPAPVTAAAPAPTPTPEVPARTPTPGEGFGAGPGAAPVVQGRPSAFGGVEVAAPTQQAPPTPAPRILQAAATPEVQAQIDAARAADEAAAKDAEKAAKKAAKENPNAARAAQHGVPPLGGKQASRNQKFYDDADAAQALLDQRPANPTIPATEPEIDALATEIGDIVKTAAGQGVELRGKVGFPTTPHSLVWLREAQEFVSKLSGKKKLELADKQLAATRFLDRETRIRKGEGEAVKVERNLEGEAAMAARGLGKGKVTEQTVEGTTVAAKVAEAKAPKVAPAREVSPEVRAEIEARTAAESIKAVKEKAAEKAAAKGLTFKAASKMLDGRVLVGDNHPDIYRDAKAGTKYGVIDMEEFQAATDGFVDQNGKFYTRAEANEYVKSEGRLFSEDMKGKEFPKPKPLPSKVIEKVEATKAKVEIKKAAQEAKLPPKARKLKKKVTIEAPKPSSPAASSAEFAAQVKEEIEPNPSDAQLAAGNASKAHVSIEGMPIAIETAANTDRHIVKPDGGRISRLYKYAYGHILGTKAPDGQPIDIFLGPEAYPGNPKLEGLQVVVIDQVDPDTKAPDEPKVMFGFAEISNPKKGTGALEAYKDSYPRGEERIGDITPMTLNQFKQWVKSKHEIKNAKEPAGEPVSELDALIAEQTEELSAEDLEADREAGGSSGINRNTSPIPIERRVKASRARAEATEKVAAAFATRTGKVSDLLDEGMDTIRSSFLGKLTRAIFPRFAKRIRELAGDVQIYVVPDDIFHNEFEKEPKVEGFYSLSGDYIILKESTTADDIEFAGLVLHEATHAAFMKAVYSDPKYIAQLEKILTEASAFNTHQYGLSSIDELMAEAFSNQAFQAHLLSIKASDELINELGLDGKKRSLWDTLVRWMGKVMGFGKAHDTLFAAVMRMSSKLELEVPNLQGPGSDLAVANFIRQTDIENAASAFSIRKRLHENLPAKVSRLLGTDTALQQQTGDPKLLFLRTMDQIIQLAKGYSRKFYEALRRAGDAIAMIRTSAERYFNETVPLIRKSLALERKYKGTGLWERFVDLVMEETRVQVYADRDLAGQTHLGKKTLKGAYPKAKWAALNTEWQALSNEAPDLMAFRQEAMTFYRDMQNKMSLGIIRNILKVAGFDDEFLAQRIFDDAETEDDILALGKTYDHIKDASALAKVEVYFPQMRRGDQVVRALYKIIPPTNAFRELPDDNGELRTWEFAGKDARKKAMDFARAQDHLTPTINSVWVDTNTGERYFNFNTPDEVRVRPEDTDAEQRFRVTIQNRFMDMFESKREAFRVAAELRNNPLVDPDSIEEVVEKRYDPGDRQADLMSYQLRTLAGSLQSRPGYQNLSPYAQNQLVQSLNIASLRMLSHTRIQSRRQPRTNVLGASKNFTRNMHEYSQSVAGYLGRLDHQEALNQAMKDARTEADASGDYGKGHGKSVIMNEMEKRVANATTFEKSNRLHEWINRVLATSFASKLISPAYNIINSLQVIMITYPALASSFGPGRAAQMLFKVYRDVGVGQILKGGLVGSKRALIEGPSAVTPSIIEDALGRLKSPQERAMVNYIIERGGINPDAGMEVSDMIETRTGALGVLDQGINYVSTFGRQMPKSIEALNRLVTAIASYRLEMQRNGGDHDAATVFAQETTNMTQGNYSHSNAAPVFNHPLGKMSFQFKKYGQAIYGMIGHNIGKAIRNAEPGDRAEAVKTLAYMAATHVVLAGALGLPTEPFKWLIIGARTAGLTEANWADVENYVREISASVFGQQLGEIMTRGISRALPEGFGFDLSSRLGMQDLLTFGEPRSAEKQDVSAFLWDMVGGAPASLAGDWMKGAQALSNGEWGEAAQRFSPVKMLTDAIKSYRVTSTGKKTAAGYESLSPYGAGEAVLRTLGFTPAREAETTEARNYFYSAQSRASAARNDLMHQWVTASPSERGRLWGTVEKYNYGKTKDEKLTRSDLDRYAKRRRTEEREGLVKSGFRVTKRDTQTYKKLGNTYNISP